MSNSSDAAFNAEAEQSLRDSLKRCSPATIEAAVKFRQTGDPAQVNIIILGLLERFMDPEFRPKLLQPDIDGLNILSDLGVDSLTMVEMVMLVEESLNLTVDNNELRGIKTIGDIKQFVANKVKSRA
jgi:3-hydroxyacyl-[acyl-carrier-protein] dehydratase